MKQDNVARYQESGGTSVTVTATPSTGDLKIEGALDGSVENFDSVVRDPTGVTKFSFTMSRRHRASFQPLFQLIDDTNASVRFTISCDHGDSFDGGTRSRGDATPEISFTFKISSD